MAKDILKVTGLSKRFGNNQAVNKVNFSIPEKKVYALIGPNGAGKTTIVKMITGLLFPDEGSISVNGIKMSKDPVTLKSHVGYIPDEPFMYPHLTGREYLHLTASLHRLDPQDTKKHIVSYANRFAVQDILDGKFSDYSRGNKQKVVIIGALLHRPRLLIFDEPIVGLDAGSQLEVIKIIQEATKDSSAVLICTHTLHFAQEVADTFGVIVQGTIKEEGALNQLRNKFGKKADLQQIFLKATQQ